MAETATMHFPGIVGVLSGNLSIGLGSGPAFAQIEVPKDTAIPREVGTLTLEAPGFFKQFPKCRVVKGSNTDRDTLLLTIADRRWMWRFGSIFLLANERAKDGTIREGNEWTPQEIARECFRVMGESGADVGALPNQTRPEARWAGTLASAELENLAGSLGCAICLWENRASLVRMGQGMPLPVGMPLKPEGLQYALDVPFVPDAVQTISGPGDFQAMFLLEAVGLEPDGRLVLIDDLSYKPEGGWEREDPEDFEGIEDEKLRQLALKSVYRYYRIKNEVGSDGVLDGKLWQVDTSVTKLDQILPVFDDLIETETLPDGSKRPKSAFIVGKYDNEDDEYQNKFGPIKTGFSLNGEKGVVEFSDPVLLLKREGQSDLNKPAELYLTCRFNIKQASTGQHWRYQFTQSTGGPRWNTEPQMELRFDIIPKGIGKYSEGTDEQPPDLEEIHFNIDDSVQPDLQEHCDAIISGMRWAPGRVETWVGWWDNFKLDGAIRQVTYSFGQEGYFTTVSHNTEQSEFVSDTLADRKALNDARQRAPERAAFNEQQRRSRF